MCGIVGYVGSKNAAPVLLDGLRRLEYRGYDSAGIAVQYQGEIIAEKAAGKLINLTEKTGDGSLVPGCCGIGHTRWATHGAPTETNAHPHLSQDGRFAVVHNGIIENYAELRKELINKGYRFASETDTEVVVQLLDSYYDGDFKAAVMKTAARLEGSYALGFMCSERPGEIIAVRSSAPLILGLGVGENYFASDVTALVANTRNVIYLDDDEFASIKAGSIEIWDVAGSSVQKPVSKVIWDVEAAEKGGYEHFMLKEIYEQPAALKAAIEPRIKEGRIVLDGLEISEEQLMGIKNIVITACGSAYHAGVVGKYIIEELCRIPVSVEVASELRYRNPIIGPESLVIIISQSGETADTIAALKECKDRGARTLGIVNVVGSTIAKLADDVLYTWAGPEIAVATTKGYTTQIAVLSLLAVYLADRLGKIDQKGYEGLLKGIQMLPERCQRSLDLNKQIPKLAKKYHENSSLFFIGRNLDYAVCLEASLKLKEISYIHSEAYAAGELKHGTIALIEEGRLVVALACYEALFDKMASNIKEVKARGAKVLGVVLEGNRKMIAEADDVIYIPKTDPMLVPILECIPMQLFAYYVAKENGCDIDKPKNLAKSVTVE